MQKVKIESVMWGAGTALGELPPYFMARAARLSGYDPDDEEELKEFEDLQKKSEQDPSSMVRFDLYEMMIIFFLSLIRAFYFVDFYRKDEIVYGKDRETRRIFRNFSMRVGK